MIRYLIKMTEYSHRQMTRLIGQYAKTGQMCWTPSRSNGFDVKYGSNEIQLLAQMDERHDTPCGQAVKKLCERAWTVFNDEKHKKLSVSHLYNLRACERYQRHRRVFTETRPRQIAIGERRKPQPEGKPGYVRIETVNQGDQDKKKGVYHTNAVDEVTQLEIVCSVEKISEHYLLPVLEQLLEAFPFILLGFHSDNGSEYINKRISRLLEKLLIELTKSRSRHSNDNALAEGKNASVVRKIFGYSYIAQKWAPIINEFNQQYLNPHVNYHRPCFSPETIEDKKGKQKKSYRYKNMMTPYDKLKSLPAAESHLKPGMTFEILDKQVLKMSENESADLLQKKRREFFVMMMEQDRTA